MNPKTALCIFTLFITGYLLFLGFAGAFTEGFLHFGPGTTEENTTSFIGVKLDSWEKVGLMYVVGFFSSLLTTYYQSVIGQNLHMYIWNKAMKEIPFSPFWTYIIVLAEPFFYQILQVIQFFTNLTLQLQFIIPQFIGSYVAEVPFTLKLLGEKTFVQPREVLGGEGDETETEYNTEEENDIRGEGNYGGVEEEAVVELNDIV